MMQSEFLEKLVQNPEVMQNLIAVLWPAEFVGDNDLEPSTNGLRIDIKRMDGNPLTSENEATVTSAIEAFEANLMAHLEG